MKIHKGMIKTWQSETAGLVENVLEKANAFDIVHNTTVYLLRIHR